MLLSYNSIGQVCITCMGTSPQLNTPCKVISNNTVAACAEGDPINGVVVAKGKTLTTVAVRGFVTLPYLGLAPTLGYCALAAAGNGKVKGLEGAREYLVLQVDTLKKTVTFCL